MKSPCQDCPTPSGMSQTNTPLFFLREMPIISLLNPATISSIFHLDDDDDLDSIQPPPQSRFSINFTPQFLKDNTHYAAGEGATSRPLLLCSLLPPTYAMHKIRIRTRHFFVAEESKQATQCHTVAVVLTEVVVIVSDFTSKGHWFQLLFYHSNCWIQTDLRIVVFFLI